MNNYTVYLKNPTPFLNELPKADTIFGALCWGLKTLYSETTLLEFINSYLNGDIPVLISSIFPFVEEDGCKHHFFPKPLLKPLNYNKEGVVSNKDKEGLSNVYDIYDEFKKKTLIHSDVLQELIEVGFDKNQFLWNRFLAAYSKSQVIKYFRDYSSFFKVVNTPGNSINRITGGAYEGKLYHKKELFIQKNCGLFFLLQLSPLWYEKIIAVFRFFEDKGLGGDSSTGKGRYKLEIQENFPVKKAEKPSLWLNLATYHPLQDEWDYFKKPGDLTYYQIATKRGLVEQWFQRSTIKLKELLLIIKEGSTFPLIPDKYSYGSLVIVQQSENGKVYQYGYAFPLWI